MGDVLMFPGKVVLGAEMATVIQKGGKGISAGIAWFSGVPSNRQLEFVMERLARDGRGNLFVGPLVLVMYADDQGRTWTLLAWYGYPLSGMYLTAAFDGVLPGGANLATLPVASWETARGLPVLRWLEVA